MVMRETKFKIGQRPWTIEEQYYRFNCAVYRVAQHKEEIAEVHIVVTENGESEIPYYAKGQFDKELYMAPVFATREEAVETVRETYKSYIKTLEEDVKFFKEELEELE